MKTLKITSIIMLIFASGIIVAACPPPKITIKYKICNKGCDRCYAGYSWSACVDENDTEVCKNVSCCETENCKIRK